MAANLLNLKKVYPLPDFKLKEPYSNNVWYIQEWDYYKNATQKHKDYWKAYGHADNPTVDFTICINPYIREELKYFMQILIEKQKVSLHSFTAYEARIRHLINFVNSEKPDMTSLTYIQEKDYTKFLLKNEIIPRQYMPDGSTLTGSMELVKNNRKHRTICILSYAQKVINNFYSDELPERKKDYWETKNFPFIDHSKTSSQKNFDFRDIMQRSIKQQAKDYCFFRLHTLVASTVAAHLSAIKTFSSWLLECYPEIDYLDQIDREIIENYIFYLRTESNSSENKVSTLILNLKHFFEVGMLLEFDRFPKNILIVSQDYAFKKNPHPEIYSEQEMKNINRVLREIPNVFAKIILVLQHQALRIEDLLNLKRTSLEEKADGRYMLKITQTKTSTPLEVEIPSYIYRLLIDQYKVSQNAYGKNVTFIFASSPTEHITYSYVMNNINRCFYNLNIMSDSGDILRFRTHKFRATMASKLLGMGYDAQTAAKALGHSGIYSLSHYGKVTNDVLITSMEPYLKKVDILVNNIGKIQEIKKSDMENALPLCNGWCCRPVSTGICDHANYCLSCSMFRPDVRHLNYYSVQLEEINAAIAVAETSENILLVNKLKKDKEQLERIIKQVNKLCEKM